MFTICRACPVRYTLIADDPPDRSSNQQPAPRYVTARDSGDTIRHERIRGFALHGAAVPRARLRFIATLHQQTARRMARCQSTGDVAHGGVLDPARPAPTQSGYAPSPSSPAAPERQG